MERGRGDDQIGLRESVAGLAAVLDHDAPPEHDFLGDRQHALREHRPHLVREPVMELGAAAGFSDQFNAKTDFGDGGSTHIEQIERLCRDEG